MDNRDEVRDFLSSRRARITAQQADLTVHGANRRVRGLRREEVAVLAQVGGDHCTRLERGTLRGVSTSALASVAAALRLDEAERIRLFDLARSAGMSAARTNRRTAAPQVRASIQMMLDAMTGAPVVVRSDEFRVRWAATTNEPVPVGCPPAKG